MKKKISIIAVALIVILLLVIPFLKNKSDEKIEYLFAKVTRGTIINEVTATGTLNPSKTVDVGTQVSGVISKLFVDFNDQVRKGQVIATIDTTALYASVADAEATVLRAQSQMVQQKKEYIRYKELLDKKAIAQSDYDLVYANYLSAESNVKSADAQLKRALTNMRYATITAPIDGIIISRNVNLGQTVAASFQTPTLFTIANDLKKMELQAKVDEADIGLVKINQLVKFTVDAYPDETFTGTVQQIRLQPTTVQNVVTYTVIIDAPNPELKLLPGMNATISITVKSIDNVLILPLAAFNFSPMRDSTVKAVLTDTIWKMENNKPVAYQVARGLDDGSYTEVMGSAVKEGMQVIIGIEPKVAKKLKSILPDPPKGGKRNKMMH